MKQPRTKIASTIADRTLMSGAPKKLSQEIAAYLMSEGRVSELDSIMRDVQADWAAAGYVEVIARSAHVLTEATKTNISKRVQPLYPEAKKIIVTAILDPEVLGGVQLSVASQQLDLSIEAKLNRFKQLTTGKD